MEFGFELALAAHLEQQNRLVSRQLGGHVHGRRIVDLVCVEPGPEFDTRTALSADTIPPTAIESDIGPGEARYWKDGFDCHPARAREIVERAVECGFFERERRNGRTYVRQVARYPDWFDALVAIENKPDLGRPGALETQLLSDVTLALFDRVVLATASHVTGAHRNRIPEAVGIWQFDPDTQTLTVIREATPLSAEESGVEILTRTSAQTEVAFAREGEKTRARRRIAERAYGKGWRTYDLPACGRIAPDDAGLPHCPWKDRLVRPVTDCGPDCDGHDPADPPPVDWDSLRSSRSPWTPDPEGKARQQSSLDQYLSR